MGRDSGNVMAGVGGVWVCLMLLVPLWILAQVK